jgi:hypothetical protein
MKTAMALIPSTGLAGILPIAGKIQASLSMKVKSMGYSLKLILPD